MLTYQKLIFFRLNKWKRFEISFRGFTYNSKMHLNCPFFQIYSIFKLFSTGTFILINYRITSYKCWARIVNKLQCLNVINVLFVLVFSNFFINICFTIAVFPFIVYNCTSFFVCLILAINLTNQNERTSNLEWLALGVWDTRKYVNQIFITREMM